MALCRLLIQEPDILLLDEPTNHLDAESVQWLELHLQQYKGTVIAVTHDHIFGGGSGRLVFGIGPRAGDSLSGQLLLLVGAKTSAAGKRGKGGVEAAKDVGARAGMDSNVSQRTACER